MTKRLTREELDEMDLWQPGLAGNANLVRFDGMDVVGVGVIYHHNLSLILRLVAYARAADEALGEIVRRDFHPQDCMSWIRGKPCDCITSMAIAACLARAEKEAAR